MQFFGIVGAPCSDEFIGQADDTHVDIFDVMALQQFENGTAKTACNDMILNCDQAACALCQGGESSLRRVVWPSGR